MTGHFIRTLYGPWKRNQANDTIRNLIESYVNVQASQFTIYMPISLSHSLQFNALLDLAKDINNDTYVSAWHGPAPGGFQAAG